MMCSCYGYLDTGGDLLHALASRIFDDGGDEASVRRHGDGDVNGVQGSGAVTCPGYVDLG